jgi:hypothetical protein
MWNVTVLGVSPVRPVRGFMRRFVRPLLTGSIAVAGASILIAAPVNAAPATDPNPDSGIDGIIKRCSGSGDPEACVRTAIEEECVSTACLRTNPNGVDVGANNPNGLSIGAANQTTDSPGASSQNPSPGPRNKSGNGPNGSQKNSH